MFSNCPNYHNKEQEALYQNKEKFLFILDKTKEKFLFILDEEKFLFILDKEKFLFILDKEKFLFVLYKEQIQNKEKSFGNHLLFNGSLTIYYIVFGDNIFIFSKYFLTILSPETISLFFPTMTSWKFGYLGTLHAFHPEIGSENLSCRVKKIPS